MIWHICFVSLTHLFEIQLFSPHINYPRGYQHAHLAWTDNRHNRLVMEPNTSGIYIDRCYNQVEHLIATCISIKRNVYQQYQCYPAQQHLPLKRTKRQVVDKPKRSLRVFLTFAIGIPCFIVGTIVGIATTAYVSIRRQQQQTDRYKVSTRLDPAVKSLSINNETTTRLQQHKVLPTLHATSVLPSRRPEQKIPGNAPGTLDRYQTTLQSQSLKRGQTFQQPTISNVAYMKSAGMLSNTFSNLSPSKHPLKQQYKASKNGNYTIKHHSLADRRSKSC